MEEEQNNNQKADRGKIALKVFTAVLMLAVMITLVLVFLYKSGGETVSKGTSESSTFIPWAAMIPIWIIAIKKSRERRGKDDKKERTILTMAAGVTLVLALITIAILMYLR